eukprot:403350747
MSFTQRAPLKTIDQQNSKNRTQNIGQLLMSNSTDSSKKIMEPTDFNKIILTTQDIAGDGEGTQRTAHNGTAGKFNHTGRNWRNLITPAQDSLNKFQKQQPEHSSYNPGSRVTTQNDKPNGATTNSHNTSMDTSNLSLSVKQFTPSQDIQQLKMTLRAGDSQHQRSLKYDQNNFPQSKRSFMYEKSHLDTIQDEETKTIKQSYMMKEHFGASTSQFKSLFQSYNDNMNNEFYENMHRKYFQNAKEKSDKSPRPPTASQLNFDKSEKDLFNLTSKTNTQLGISQFKSSIESSSQFQNEKPSMLRASSLKDNRQKQDQPLKSGMSINFKNSLYNKINSNNALLDDNSRSQLDNKSKIFKERSLQRKVMNSFLLDSSSEESDQEEAKQPINLKSHIQKNKKEVLGNITNQQKKEENKHRHELFEDKNILSRRDLSSRLDDNKARIGNSRSPNQLSYERLNKFHRNNKINDNSNSRSRSTHQQIDDSASSLNLFHRLLSSDHQNIKPKITSQMSSVILSNPDFNLQSQFRQGDDHLIFKQAIQENDLEETYDAKFNNITQQEHLDLKPEDLSVIIENNFGNQNYSSSKVQQQDEIFNTFKQLMKNARSQPKIEEIQQFDKNQSSHQNSIQMPNQIQNRIGYSQLSGNNYERQKSFKGQSGKYSKDMNANLDQRSDFTFVLTNQTDFHCECAQQDNNQNNSSFVTNKFRKPSTVNNSDLKSQNQNLSSYRKGPFQTITQPPRLQDFGASPIYSENGGLPGTQFYINPPVGVCNNCGGCRNQSNQHKKQQHTNIQHRLSYNQVNYQSIKEESQDGDEEYRQNENFINSQIDDSGISGNSHNVDQCNKVFEYQKQNQHKQQNNNNYSQPTKSAREMEITSGETSLQQDAMKQSSSVEEEINNHQGLISFQQDYIGKIFQDLSVSSDLKCQLAQILSKISTVQYSQPSLNLNHLQQNLIHQGINLQQNSQDNNHFISQLIPSQPSDMIFVDNNMTLSEIHNKQRQQNKLNNQKQNNYNVNQRQVPSHQVDSGEPMTNLDTFNQNQLQATNALQGHKQTVGSKQQQYYSEFDQQQQNLMNKYQNLQNSLISTTTDDPNFNNKLKSETVYSYIDQEINDETSNYTDENEDSLEREKSNQRDFGTLRQSEFLQSTNRSNKYQMRKLRQSQNGHSGIQSHNLNIIRALEIKKSLKKTKKSLLSTKQQLRKEKIINQRQEDKMKKLEAQIEALTQRWTMTENNIKSKENMIQLLQRINSQNSVTKTSIIAGLSIQQNIDSNFNVNTNQNSSNIYTNKDSSNNTIQNNSQRQSNFINQLNTSTSYMGANQEQSRKQLLEINDRLTKQIEDNLALFEDLNQELTFKDRVIADNHQKLQEKQKEVELLSKRLNDMSDSMKQMIEITKSTSDQTEQSKIQHKEEMDKIKRRQSDYQKKLDKINQVFSNIPDITNISHQVSNHSSIPNGPNINSYSKYLENKGKALGKSTQAVDQLILQDQKMMSLPLGKFNQSKRLMEYFLNKSKFCKINSLTSTKKTSFLRQINKIKIQQNKKEIVTNQKITKRKFYWRIQRL